MISTSKIFSQQLKPVLVLKMIGRVYALYSVFCIRKKIGIKFYTLKRMMCCIFLLPGPPHYVPWRLFHKLFHLLTGDDPPKRGQGGLGPP